MPCPPAAVTASAVSSIVSGRSYSDRWARVVRPVQYTVAPAAPSSMAMPRPAPRVAPATSATRPVSGAMLRRSVAVADQSDDTHHRPDDLEQDESVLALQHGDDGERAGANEVEQLVGDRRRAHAAELARGEGEEDEHRAQH